ncbi:hypothetical protein Tsubulata_014032 [Turnera subulata]|uniref:Uncharacterized protein n=1 Tax=Turnera subulata TaxID=218843 RepID=A0A9Q0JK89_9ROSI|nr:hypothetical protein Tsubulata_014032 [Turnera subulata]
MQRDEVSGASVNGRQTLNNWPKAEHDHYQQKFEFQGEKSAGEVQSSAPLVLVWSHFLRPEYDILSSGSFLFNLGFPNAEGSCLIESNEAQDTTDVLPNRVSSHPAYELVNLHEQCCGNPGSAGVLSPNAVCWSVSTVPNPAVTPELVASLLAASTNGVSPQHLESNKSSKAMVFLILPAITFIFHLCHFLLLIYPY